VKCFLCALDAFRWLEVMFILYLFSQVLGKTLDRSGSWAPYLPSLPSPSLLVLDCFVLFSFVFFLCFCSNVIRSLGLRWLEVMFILSLLSQARPAPSSRSEINQHFERHFLCISHLMEIFGGTRPHLSHRVAHSKVGFSDVTLSDTN
jgi:hypothetical protein